MSDPTSDPTHDPTGDPTGDANGEPPGTLDAVDALLQRWRDRGWLRPLDLAFARFLREQQPALPAGLYAAAALLAQLEGLGHTALPLHGVLAAAPRLLGWPPEALAELAALRRPWPGDDEAAAWPAGPLLECDPADDGGATPLVLDRGRLYLRRAWRDETGVARQVRARLAADDADAAVDAPRARALLDALFGASDPRRPNAQKVAGALALRGRLTVVTGGPGTGKTWTAARLLALLRALHDGPQPLRIALAAPTGKAASRLRQAIGQAMRSLPDELGGIGAQPLPPARTLHALLGARPGTRRFAHDASRPLDVDLLVVDEASMVHLEMMAALLDALPPAARIVLLGDKDQLASVEAGAVMGDLCAAAGEADGVDAATAGWLLRVAGETAPVSLFAAPGLARQVALLRESRRFDGAIGQLAQAVNAGDAAGLLRQLAKAEGARGEVALRATRDPQQVVQLALRGREGAAGGGKGAAAAGGYAPLYALLAERPADPAAFEAWALALLARFDAFRVLCALRDGPWGVAGLNDAIAQALERAGALARRGEWYEGRPVMVTRNDASLGVFNGDIGLVLRSPSGGPLRAWFAEGGVLRSVSVARLADVETAFAMTVHKSQGSEFGHVVLALPEADSALLTRELVYTGITRAREALTIVAPTLQRVADACSRTTRRVGGLRERLADGPRDG